MNNIIIYVNNYFLMTKTITFRHNCIIINITSNLSISSSQLSKGKTNKDIGR